MSLLIINGLIVRYQVNKSTANQVENVNSFSGLLNNSALMMTLCVVYDTFGFYAFKRKQLRNFITGILVGLVAIAVMLSPWSLQPGVFFDTRWILLSLCGLFFGLIPTSVAVVIAGSFRRNDNLKLTTCANPKLTTLSIG